MHNFADGRTYTSEYGLRFYRKSPGDASDAMAAMREAVEKELREKGVLFYRFTMTPEYNAKLAEQYAAAGFERALAPSWAVWLNRIFWMSWFLFLFNLIPAYPLDGGQMLQAIIWGRTDYRRGVVVAAYSGYVIGVLLMIVSIWAIEPLVIALAMFILYMSWTKLMETRER